MPATEIASAYLALYAKMPGVQKDIEKQLGGSDVQSGAEKSGKKVGGALMKGLGGVAVAGTAAVVGAVGVSLVKGFSRLDALDQARAKLTGLGHDADSVQGIMDNALAAVRGTAFGMDQAAGTAGTLVAAGVKPGQDLERVLKLVGDAATIAGTDMGDMGSIFSKVAATGKLNGEVLQQLSERGIPVLSNLASMYGVSTEEAQKMVSQGKVSFEDFAKVMQSTLGGAALASGDTFQGALANMGASFSRIGAGLLGGAFSELAPTLTAITNALGPVEEIAASVGEKIGGFLAPAFEAFRTLLEGGFDLGGFLDILSVLSPLGLAFKVLQPVLPMLLDHFMAIASVVGGTLAGVFEALMPTITTLVNVFSGVLAAVLPQILPLFQNLAGVLGDVLVAVLPLVGQLVSALLPAFNVIAPVIAALMPIFTQLIGLLMPIVGAILPVLSSLIQTLAPIFTSLVAAILPILQPILALLQPLLDLIGVILPPLIQLLGWLVEQALIPVQLAFDALMPIITGVVNAISTLLVPIIDTITTVLDGLITFLTGVFTGNWEMAWQGVMDIFSGIWEGVQDIAKGALNAIIDVINGIINGINGMADGLSTVTGGAIDLSIPEIPRLAEGAVVSRRPGGILANIGEGRYDEAVVPLSPGVLSQLGSGTGGGDVNVYVDGTGMDEHTVGTIVGNEVAFALRG